MIYIQSITSHMEWSMIYEPLKYDAFSELSLDKMYIDIISTEQFVGNPCNCTIVDTNRLLLNMTYGTEGVIDNIKHIGNKIIEFVKRCIKYLKDIILKLYDKIKSFFVKSVDTSEEQSKDIITDIEHIKEFKPEVKEDSIIQTIANKLNVYFDNTRIKIYDTKIFSVLCDSLDTYVDKIEETHRQIENSNSDEVLSANAKFLIEQHIATIPDLLGEDVAKNYANVIGSGQDKELRPLDLSIREYFKRLGFTIDANIDTLETLYDNLKHSFRQRVGDIDRVEVACVERIVNIMLRYEKSRNKLNNWYNENWNFSKEDASRISTADNKLARLISQVATMFQKSINVEVNTVNKILHTVTDSLKLIVGYSHKAIIHRYTKDIEERLSGVNIISTFEGYDVLSARELYLIMCEASDSEPDADRLNVYTSDYNAAAVVPHFGSKPYITLNDPVIHDEYINENIAHEYGHILNNHVVNYILDLSSRENRGLNNWITLKLKRRQRNVKDEIQADKEAMNRCGLDRTIGYLEHMIKILGISPEIYNYGGKYIGNNNARRENDIWTRLRYFKNLKEKESIA